MIFFRHALAHARYLSVGKGMLKKIIDILDDLLDSILDAIAGGGAIKEFKDFVKDSVARMRRGHTRQSSTLSLTKSLNSLIAPPPAMASRMLSRRSSRISMIFFSMPLPTLR